MPNVQIPLAGPTYVSRSKSVSSAITRNFYLEQSPENASLIPFPGLKPFSVAGTGKPRGLGVFKGELYAVNGTSLYKVSSSGVSASVGVIGGFGRCVLTEASSSLVITTGDTLPYKYDTVITLGADVDLPRAATSTYIKNRVVYDGANGDIVFADLGSPLDVNSANITASDVKPDSTLAVRAFRDQLFAFGTSSIAPYYNSGSGNPPYAAIQNAASEIGLHAIHSIDANQMAMYFLGSDLMPYRIRGVQPEPIGDQSICQALAGYDYGTSDAYGKCFSFDGQYFYLLTIPGQETWLYSEGKGWTNLAFGVNGDPHLLHDYAYCYNKHLVSDRRSGSIYELDFDTYDDNGEVIQRRRETRRISGKDFGFPGKKLFMNSLELVMETGTGIASGQGSIPRVMMSFSDDGGRTWSPEKWASFGSMGSFTYDANPRWSRLGSFYERQFRFTVTDPVKTVFVSLNADIEVGP